MNNKNIKYMEKQTQKKIFGRCLEKQKQKCLGKQKHKNVWENKNIKMFGKTKT